MVVENWIGRESRVATNVGRGLLVRVVNVLCRGGLWIGGSWGKGLLVKVVNVLCRGRLWIGGSWIVESTAAWLRTFGCTLE